MKASTIEQKRLRAVHVNELILSISNHGRKFFRKGDFVSKVFVQPSGRVFILDAGSKKLIYTHTERRWDGFSHGGTLRDIVCMMRDYIMKGEQIDIRVICQKRLFDDSNIWGYTNDEAVALLKEVESNPCIFGDAS